MGGFRELLNYGDMGNQTDSRSVDCKGFLIAVFIRVAQSLSPEARIRRACLSCCFYANENRY
jgi:hypothetical protein